MTVATPNATPRKSSWIPWVFVGAMGVVVAVNGVLITYAVSSFSGLVVPKPYERGVNYNQVLDAKHRQDALGWTIAVKAEVTGEGGTGRVLLHARDKNGQLLSDLTLTAKLVRPLEVMDPVPVTFDAVGDGRYVARVTFPKPGQWDLKGTIARGDTSYQLIERVIAR